MVARPFRVELAGSFHTAELYDSNGSEVYDIDDAASCAECEYGDEWVSVFNGNESWDREAWILACLLMGQSCGK